MRWKNTGRGTCENLRVLLSTESLQCPSVLHPLFWTCLQLTLQALSGSKSGWNHFFAWIWMYIFGSISCWKIQAEPACNLLAEAVWFSMKISWYFMESMMLFILLEEKLPCNTTEPPPYSQWGLSSSLYNRLSFLYGSHFEILLPKNSIFISCDYRSSRFQPELQ